MSQQKVGESSREEDCDNSDFFSELEWLNFPGDVDWSSTLVLRCDPGGGPYSLTDVTHALHELVFRNEVFNLGPSVLNHVFTISFKSANAAENFVRFVRGPKVAAAKGLRVKGHPCTLTRVPSKIVEVHVRHVPLEVDTKHVVEALSHCGQVVKTELVRSNFRGWFHVYTNERKLTMYLKHNVNVSDLPYSIEVKGLVASVLVVQRTPKCLECYYSGHKKDSCEYKQCMLYNDCEQ